MGGDPRTKELIRLRNLAEFTGRPQLLPDDIAEMLGVREILPKFMQKQVSREQLLRSRPPTRPTLESVIARATQAAADQGLTGDKAQHFAKRLTAAGPGAAFPAARKTAAETRADLAVAKAKQEGQDRARLKELSRVSRPLTESEAKEAQLIQNKLRFQTPFEREESKVKRQRETARETREAGRFEIAKQDAAARKRRFDDYVADRPQLRATLEASTEAAVAKARGKLSDAAVETRVKTVVDQLVTKHGLPTRTAFTFLGEPGEPIADDTKAAVFADVDRRIELWAENETKENAEALSARLLEMLDTVVGLRPSAEEAAEDARRRLIEEVGGGAP